MGGSEGLMDVINCMFRAAEVASMKVRDNGWLRGADGCHQLYAQGSRGGFSEGERQWGCSEGLMDAINCMFRAAEVTSVKVRDNGWLRGADGCHQLCV